MLNPRTSLSFAPLLIMLFIGSDHRSGCRAETMRVRQHLLGAERLLVARDLTGLDDAQRDARLRSIGWLRDYARKGRLPHNHVSTARTPVFVDGHGTRCAMAWLIERTGGHALVARIARTRNLARIRELSCDRELVAWLDRNGLTLDEAARIQPQYDGPGTIDSATPANFISGLGAVLGAAGVGLNVTDAKTRDARNARGLAGVTLGVLGVGLAFPALTAEGAQQGLGVVDLALGTLSFGLGLHQLNLKPRDPVALTRTWSPIVDIDRTGTRRIAVQLSF